MDFENFDDGAVLVIGGSGGIGAEICRRFAEKGSDVAFTYRTAADRAETLAAAVRAFGKVCDAHPLDIEDAENVRRTIEAVEERHGSIHTVIYASGPKITHEGFLPIANVAPAEWERVIKADVIGYFNLISAALPALRRSRGSIVALATAGLARYPSGDILSAGPKASVAQLTRGIAREEGRNGVRANVIGVGWIDAGQGIEMKEILRQSEFAERFLKATPLRRFGTARDIADTALYFASASASYISGNVINVDGGGHI